MNYKLQDTININDLKKILIKINDTYSFTVAIIDSNKEVITTSKWQKFNLQLDQNNKKYSKEFEKSFESIIEIIDYKVPSTLTIKCFQGILYIAYPLIIKEKSYGYILAGQFFLKEPDIEIYKNTAKQYGLDEANYLKAISKIPIITKKEIENHLSFIHEYIEMSITNHKLIQKNKASSDIDIMEGKEIKNALIASEGRFKKLVESIIDYIYSVRIEKGKEISTSHGPGCVTVTGYTSEEYNEDPYLWYQMVFEGDRDAVIKQASMMISGKQALPLEHRIIHKNGSIKWVRNTPVLRYNEKHAVIGYDGLIVDITERKRFEEILEKDKEELKQIIDSSPIIVFYKDNEGKFIRVNKAFAEALNIPEEKFIGKTVFDFYSINIAQGMTDDDKEVLSTKKPKLNIIEQYESAAGLRWVRTDKMPIFDKKGNLIGLIGFAQDITDQKKAEESLRESEMKYRALIENSLLGICISQQNQIIYANKALMNMFGYDDFDEFSSKPFLEYLTSESKTYVHEWRKKKAKGENLPMEMIHNVIRKDGKIRILRLGIMYITLNNIKYSYTTFIDITEQKKAEELLRESEERFRTAFENANVGVCLVNTDGYIFKANNMMSQIFGYSKEEFEKMHVNDITYPDDREISPVFIQNVLAGKIDQSTFDKRYIHKNGRLIWGHVSSSIVRDSWEKPMYFISHIQDITERKKVENDLLESEKKFRTFVETTKEWIWTIDLEGKHTYCNPAIESILGYEPEELIGNNSFNFIHPDDLTKVKEIVKGKIEEKKGWSNLIIRWKHKDGSFRYLESNASPIFDSDGNLKGFQGADRDITERKEAEQALIKFNEELEKHVQQRTEELINVNKELESFSYTVSHDLRAPLRSINGFSQILMEDYKDQLDEEALNYLKRIINSSNKLAELIDHLLNLSRITRSEVHKVKVDLSKMANDIIIELKELNPDRKIDFICEKGIIVDADYTLIHSALYNLIHNAWKYTSKRSKAKIEFKETKKLDNRVFYIKDNGAGFDMKYSDKLFKVFQRLHSEREFEGTGIGLATVNHIISKHGGKTWVESEINKGTTIYFTLG